MSVAAACTVGDSYDNAMAESVIGLYKAECVKRGGVPMFLVKLRGVVASGWGPGRARGF